MPIPGKYGLLEGKTMQGKQEKKGILSMISSSQSGDSSISSMRRTIMISSIFSMGRYDQNFRFPLIIYRFHLAI